MHSSVLQNKKYMKFAGDSTVEVIAVSSLDKAISKKDPKAGTYDGMVEGGKEAKFLISWPGLTVEDTLKDQVAFRHHAAKDLGHEPRSGPLDEKVEAIAGRRRAAGVESDLRPDDRRQVGVESQHELDDAAAFLVVSKTHQAGRILVEDLRFKKTRQRVDTAVV